MKLLLDTHALLWWWTNDAQLSTAARDAIADGSNEILVSAASAWEIGTKFRLGKLPLAREAVTRYQELISADGFAHLPMTHFHALRAAAFASEHRDPFDRMIAAQAHCESATVITRDVALADLLADRKALW